MGNLQSNSAAFRQALLQSERLRIRIVLGALAAVFILRTLRTFTLQNREDIRSWFIACLLFILFAGYELLVLRAVRRAADANRNLGAVAWVGSTIVETSIPALAMAFLTSPVLVPAYRPLANPAVLWFVVFITLSILRLNPWACRLSGITATCSYLAAASYLGWSPQLISGSSIFSPQRAVYGYAIVLLIAGIIAGMVAAEVQKYVEAALREAEAQRAMEHVQHDLKVARSIQQSLLPSQPPQIEGFEVAGWNQPADETGGDYFDWQVLPDGKVVVALADVTGHGIGPALLASVCRAYSRANFSLDESLMKAMARINSALASDLTEGRFVTFVAAVCSPGASRVELLSAGHGPLFMYLLKDDSFTTMGSQGLPLGISPSLISDPPQCLELLPGDLLILSTDGFFEWANAAKEEFGTARMEAVIRSSKHLSAKEIISALYAGVIEFSGGTKQQDDLTAIVIKRT